MTLPMLDPDLLRAFLAVADHRSFTRAAARLNRTQSAVSMQIRRLEMRVAAELFRRNTTMVELTQAGESLVTYARRILALNEEAVGKLRQHRIEGRVRLGVMDDYGSHVLPSLLARFLTLYPRIHVEMETGLTSTMLGRLGESYDLVIAMHAEGHGSGELLRLERPVWAASAEHQAWLVDPLPVALYPMGCLFRKWAIEALDAARRSWRLAFVSHNLATVEAVAAQGLAVTVVKSSFLPRRLRSLSPGDGLPALPGAEIRLHLAPDPTRAVAMLADHLREAFAAIPDELPIRRLQAP
ncbi:LysR family transcriptional regulator [Labrys sp. ZIDIC5]|uniref:LysR family transcriptional regulator n=1 Tax=Labrys sedimenti TaxID=3106036 RepID=UPI002AC9FA51|nr:LysR family transcriptional regulator [Labrys sp. ZIDIC5]MDZ5448577.1 LysR family transcriptional regulator [Labrys sp. ZIDIC5]